MRADRAARAGAIFDDNRLAERGAEFVRNRSRHNIAGTSGSVGNDQLDRVGRIGLTTYRHGTRHTDNGGGKRNRQPVSGPHDKILPMTLVVFLLLEAVKPR